MLYSLAGLPALTSLSIKSNSTSAAASTLLAAVGRLTQLTALALGLRCFSQEPQEVRQDPGPGEQASQCTLHTQLCNTGSWVISCLMGEATRGFVASEWCPAHHLAVLTVLLLRPTQAQPKPKPNHDPPPLASKPPHTIQLPLTLLAPLRGLRAVVLSKRHDYGSAYLALPWSRAEARVLAGAWTGLEELSLTLNVLDFYRPGGSVVWAASGRGCLLPASAAMPLFV
jgi:hypothetical protein